MGAPSQTARATTDAGVAPEVGHRLEHRVLLAGLLVTTAAVVATRVVHGASAIRFADNVHWTAAYGFAAAAALLSTRHATGRARRAKRWFAAGLISLFVGQLTWDVQVASGWNPFPGPSDMFFLALGPLYGAGVLSLTEGASRARRAAVLLDGLGFGFAILALTLAVYLPRQGVMESSTIAVMAAYPTALITSAAVLVVVLCESRQRPDGAWVLVFLGVLGHGFLWMEWNRKTLDGTLGDGIFINYVFSYVTLLLGLGVTHFEPSTPKASRLVARGYSLALRLLPLTFVVAASTAVLVSSDSSPAVRFAVTVCMGGAILVSVIRQSLLLEDRDRQLAAEAELRVLQERLSQSQRLESLGTLAGGIAHDFNNILTAIVAQLDLLAIRGQLHPEAQTTLGGVRAAALRARDVVSRVLAFARQESVRPEPVPIAELVREVVGLLRAGLPARHGLELVGPVPGVHVLASPGQLHQVLMNLGTNASQAIGEKNGLIRFAVAVRKIGAGNAELAPGDYVELAVSDDGTGMSDEVKQRIFEPFFTTKPRGQGTGLGLSVIHGIVSEHRGVVRVESKLGAGSTFRVLLPLAAVAAEAAVLPAPAPPAPPCEPSGESTCEVLVVDDEAILGRVLVQLLESMGHRALSTTSPEQAIAYVRQAPARFGLVITDMSMPGMSGVELASALHAIRPDLPILLSSGTDVVITGTPFADVLPKPYGVERVEELLDKYLRRAAPPSA